MILPFGNKVKPKPSGAAVRQEETTAEKTPPKVETPQATQKKTEPTTKQTPVEVEEPPETKVFRNEKGNLSGIELPDGRVFLGLSPDEVREISQREAMKRETPEGSIEYKDYKENKRIAQEGQQLAVQQAQETQEIQDLVSLQNQADTMTRLSQAGLILPAKALNWVQEKLFNAGLTDKKELFSAEEMSQSNFPFMRGAGVVMGYVQTLDIAGISLSTIFNPASKNVKNLQGDAAELTMASEKVMRNVITRGANIDQSIQTLRILEEGVRIRYADANKSLKESPQDIAEGLDLYDAMSRDLIYIVGARQVLERYKLTGDTSELLNYVNTGATAE